MSHERHHLRRLPARGSYDAAVIHAILDEAYVCHLGLAIEGQPLVVPHSHWRVGDELLIHTAAAGRIAKALIAGAEACIAVSLVDGLVLARSAFHHSMNYRSVMVFGKARLLEDEAEQLAACAVLIDKMVPGRSKEARVPNRAELKTTAILAFRLDEASAKMRAGPPKDSAEDMALAVPAGVVPLTTVRGALVPDA